MNIIKYRKFFIAIAIIYSILFAFSYIKMFVIIPSQITLFEGEEYKYNFKCKYLFGKLYDKKGVVTVKSINSNKNNINFSDAFKIKSNITGEVNLNTKILGFIPFKTVKINILKNKKIIACGDTVGVKIMIDGLLVLGLSDVEDAKEEKFFPAKDAGIRAGDLILEANNKRLISIDDLISEVSSSNGKFLKLKIKRGNRITSFVVKPVLSVDDGHYHIGLWVRDSTIGIGTLTFYDKQTNYFGALGHGITDFDTGMLLPLFSGEILESHVLSVKKGKSGLPGELKGYFSEDKKKLGDIKYNLEYGIYGVICNKCQDIIKGREYPIAHKDDIKKGKASILSNVEGNFVDEYSIVIQKVSNTNFSGFKGMLIKITDKRLLDITGGIVQGMSGSPIIQNGKIIGAVTHVLIDDPTRGYGIFIENMLKNTASKRTQLVKAKRGEQNLQYKDSVLLDIKNK